MSPGRRIRERLRLLLGRAVTTVIVGDLECPTCLVLTPHEAHYVAGLLHHVQCESCGQRWEMGHDRLRASYLRALPGRIRSKPARLVQEARSRPVTFAVTIPLRVLSKPARIAGEAGAVVGVFR